MNDRIQSLLRQKSPDQLDDAERAEVLSEMSLTEYDVLYRSAVALRSMDADAAPSPALRERLLAHGRAQGRFGNPNRQWWQHHIPAWQAAAAALLLAGAVWFFRDRTEPPVREKLVERVLIQKDTVFRTDTLWRRQVVVRYLPAASVAPPPVNQDDLQAEVPVQSLPEQPGTSIGDMPALMEFLGDVNN